MQGDGLDIWLGTAHDPTMRLSPEAVDAIRSAARALAGPDARVRVFGSRLDDSARGGDVDLLLELPTPVAQPAWLSANLAARISRALGGRAVDVVISAPNLRRLPVHAHAQDNGIPL
jgi:hypothetical protein